MKTFLLFNKDINKTSYGSLTLVVSRCEPTESIIDRKKKDGRKDKNG